MPEPGGMATKTIRRVRVKSSRVPLVALGVISPWNPLSTLRFHKENAAIAEGLVLLRDRILESSELGVLCFRYELEAAWIQISNSTSA